MKYLYIENLKNECRSLSCGEKVFLSGAVFTARDAAHKRIREAIKGGLPLPFPIENSVIYYTGPTPAHDGFPIGSCGPTTSSRMDVYTPSLYDMGLSATIGKGPRSSAVIDSIVRNGAVYFCAIGGAGALLASSVVQCDVIAYGDLGCESVKRLILDDFPVYVGIDSFGNSLFR